MIRSFEETSAYLLQGSKAKYAHSRHKYVAQSATVKDLEELASCIEERRFLTDCVRLIDSLGEYSFVMLCDKALPAMFTHQELRAYFLDVLVSLHEDEGRWAWRSKRELYRMITGAGFCLMRTRNKPLQVAFSEAYDDDFLRLHRLPKQFKDRAVEAILARRSLADVYSEFLDKYRHSAQDSFMSWFSTCVLSHIGEDEFVSYVRQRAEVYVSGLPGTSYRHFTYVRMTSFILGFPWNPVDKATAYKSRKGGSPPGYYLLAKIFARELLPYTYAATTKRKAVYDLLGLTEEERREYDEKAKKVDRSFVPAGMMIIGDAQLPQRELSGPAGMQDLFEALDEYVRERFLSNDAPRGPIPSSSITRSGFESWLAAKNDLLHRAFKEARGIPALSSSLDERIETSLRNLRWKFYEENAAELASGKEKIWLYFPKKGVIGAGSIDFAPLRNHPAIEREARSFMLASYQEAVEGASNCSLARLPKTMTDVIRVFAHLCSEYDIANVEDISEMHLLAELSHTSKEGKGTGTLVSRLGSVRRFFRFQVERGRLSADPSVNIRLKRGAAYHETTPEIPEDVLAFIEGHVDELRAHDVRLFFKVGMETGWRASDIRNILAEDVMGAFCSPDAAEIKTRTSKTVASRIKRRLGDKLYAMISSELRQEIIEYIDETATLRELYGIDTVFFSVTNGAKADFPSEKVNSAINKLLEDHGIESVDESYDVFSMIQTRKTVAVELISSGAPRAAVQKQLGHVSSSTTERFYAHVRNKKLAELNSEFYRQKFDLLIDSGRLDLYTEEERRVLYVDFCTNRRNVELGVCSKHPSEGRCDSMASISCACCPKLCTGTAYKGRWERLLEDSSSLLASFVAKYEELGIPREGYETFVEYRQEKLVHERYMEVISAIENGGAI